MTPKAKAPDPLISRVLHDAFEIVAPIGRGAMGAVYRGRQLVVGREVAIKFINSGTEFVLEDQEILARRFKREAYVLSSLEHPNSVRLIDFGQTEDGLLYLVLELLKGHSLGEVLYEDERLEPARVARIGAQVCRALDEAHGKGIVHRDLKPDNIFLCEYSGQTDFVKVMDYGLARVMDEAPVARLEEPNAVRMTRMGTTLGTPPYMSPEQAFGAEVHAASDLYAVGILLYEMLTGEPPFIDDDPMVTLARHVHEEPKPVTLDAKLPKGVQSAWQELLDRLLAKRPEDRPASASEVADVLERLMLASAGDAPETFSTDPLFSLARMRNRKHLRTVRTPERRWAGTRRHLAWAAPALALGLGAVAWIAWPEPSAERPGATAGAALARVEAPQAPRAGVIDEAATLDMPLELIADEPDAEIADEDVPVTTLTFAEDDAGGLRVVDEDEQAEAPEPGPKPAQLSVQSVPAGATVLRGGQALCKTPCSLTLPPREEAEHFVVRRKGFADANIEVDLREAAVIAHTVTLARRGGPSWTKLRGRGDGDDDEYIVEPRTRPSDPSRELPRLRLTP